MIKKTILALILIALATAALAQYDERAVMTQTAQNLFLRRQYADAEQAWLLLLQKYPTDTNAVSQLFQMYLQISQSDKAIKLLNDYGTVLPYNTRLEYEIQLDVSQAKLKDAWDKAQAYIVLSPVEEHRYRLLASYFERKGFFEQAIRLYEQGRKAVNNNDAFSMEIGNAAFSSQIYDKAMTEYIRFLESKPGNVYYVGNQLKNILTENPELISQLRSLSKASTSPDVKEVYAISLSRMGRLSEALAEYEQLPTVKLYAFANEQFTAGKDSLAIAAFNSLLSKQLDMPMLGSSLLMSAESYIHLRQYAAAESILAQIVNPANKIVNSRFVRMRFPFQAYIILSDLAQWQGRDVNTVIELLNEARKVAVTSDDVIDADYRLIGIHYVNEQYEQAEVLLKKQNVLKQQDRWLYYHYLISLSKSEVDMADSLLNQLVIAMPSSKYVNDLMTMNILLMNLKPEAQGSFLSAYRYRLSHRDSLAVQTIYDLSLSTKDEELRILAADWALASGLKNLAESIYSYDWQDELLQEYAMLQMSKLQSNASGAESMAQDFLKSKPNSVFSPSFRQILQKAPTAKRSL